MADAPTLLARSRLFPAIGVPLHVNRPVHHGDVPLHRHDFLEIAVVAGGSALHRTITGLNQVKAGEVFVLRPGEWHAYECCRDLRLANCCFGAELLGGALAWLADDAVLGPLLGLTPAPAPASLTLDPAATATAVDLLDGVRARQNDHPEQHRIELIGQLTTFLGVLGHASLASRPLRTKGSHPAVARIVALMSAEPARNWSIDDLTKAADLDRAYLIRLFRRITGLTPMAWLARARGEQAAILLLTTDASVADIGRRVGWPDPGHFARRFKSLFGQPPGDYRRQLPVPAEANLAEAWIQW